MGQMDGKVAIVTGAARGLGAAEAELIAQEGGSVVVAHVLADQADELADRIRQAGGRAVAVALDVTSEADWAGAVIVAEDFGGIHALVNNAGISYRVGLLDADLDEWNRVMSVNLTGCLLGMRAVVPAMRRAGGGWIVNVSSIAGSPPTRPRRTPSASGACAGSPRWARWNSRRAASVSIPSTPGSSTPRCSTTRPT